MLSRLMTLLSAGLLVGLGACRGSSSAPHAAGLSPSPVSGDAAGSARDAAQPRPCRLMVGDPAPPLEVETWINGPELRAFEPGTVYVLELWATWCLPCREVMPQLAELQARYADRRVQLIGVNVRDDPTRVEPFLTRAHDGATGRELMPYPIAIEAKGPDSEGRGASRPGKVSARWLERGCQWGLPSSFIVDRSGRVAWVGHPSVIELPLEMIARGTWDIRERAAIHAAEIGARPQLAEFKRLMLNWEYDQAYRLGRELAEGAFSHNPLELNAMAWRIVDPDLRPRQQDLDLALAAARRAAELTLRRDAAVLHTLATVHAQRGELDQAVAVLEEASALASSSAREVIEQELGRR